MTDNRNTTDWPHIQIYTDGGAEPNPGPGGWGAILLHPAKTREISGGDPHTTNNRMELTAAIEALKALTRPCVIDFYTDSEYLQKGMTEWIKKWVARGQFDPDSDKRPANADLWEQLIELTPLHEIRWHWVKGHAGNEWNERADQLASAAIPSRSNASSEGFARLVLLASNQKGQFVYVASVTNADQAAQFTNSFREMTTNHGILLAAIEVLEQLPPDMPILFLTNSSYLVDGITKWIKGWKTKGFKKFEEDWRRLDALNNSRRIHWGLFKDSDDEQPPEVEGLRRFLRENSRSNGE